MAVARSPGCCEGLECVLGDCYDCFSAGRVGDGCDPAEPAACCGGSGAPCLTGIECCGGSICTDGFCT